MSTEYAGGFSPREKGWWVFAFGTTEISNAQSGGNALIVPLSTIPKRQGERWLHIVEAAVKITVRLDTTAAGMTADLQGEQISAFVSRLSLMDIFGWEYLRPSEFDGRATRDVMSMLTGYKPSATAQNVPDADNTDLLRTVVIPIRFQPGVPEIFCGTSPRRIDQMQPLFFFDERSGSAGLRINLAAALPGAPAGITDNTVTLCEVRIRTYADRDLHVDAPWWARINTPTQTSFTLLPDAAGKDPGHRLFGAAIRHTPEDAGGAQNLNDYGAITINHGEDTWVAGRTAVEMATEWNEIYQEDGVTRALEGLNTALAASPARDFGSVLVDVANPTWLPLMLTKPGSSHAEWGQAPIVVALTRAAGRTNTRCMTYGYAAGLKDAYQKMAAATIGLDPEQIAVGAKGGYSATGKSAEPFAPTILRKVS